MEKLKMAFILSLLFVLLSACNQKMDLRDSIEVEHVVETKNQLEIKPQKTEFVEDKHDRISIEKIDEIEVFLYEQVYELDNYINYISSESDEAANLTIRIDDTLVDVYKDGEGSEYLGKYYAVYVGESWIDHSVRWDSFYVSADCDKILWKDTIRLKGSDFDMYTLEEWRNSPYYRHLDE